jgi:hypothetical protein
MLQINSQQANLAGSPAQPVALKDKQFRIDAVPLVQRYGSAM